MSHAPRLASLFAVVLAISSAASAQTTLFDFTVPIISGMPAGPVTSVSFPVDYLETIDLGTTRIFDQFHFTAADVGRTVTVTRETDPQFDAFTRNLTDGVKQDLDFLFLPEPPREESGTIFTEPLVVWNDANDLRVDLRGTRVDAYTLRIDRLNIFPQGGFDSQVTFSAISVPEPAGALAAAALGGLLLRRENRTR